MVRSDIAFPQLKQRETTYFASSRRATPNPEGDLRRSKRGRISRKLFAFRSPASEPSAAASSSTCRARSSALTSMIVSLLGEASAEANARVAPVRE